MSAFMVIVVSALIYKNNKATFHFRKLGEINYFASSLKMTVFTYYLEIFFQLLHQLQRVEQLPI